MKSFSAGSRRTIVTILATIRAGMLQLIDVLLIFCHVTHLSATNCLISSLIYFGGYARPTIFFRLA